MSDGLSNSGLAATIACSDIPDTCGGNETLCTSAARLLRAPIAIWLPIVLLPPSSCVLAVWSMQAMRETAARLNPNFISSLPTFALLVSGASLLFALVLLAGLASRWHALRYAPDTAVILVFLHAIMAGLLYVHRSPFDASWLSTPFLVVGALWVALRGQWNTREAKRFLGLCCPTCDGPDIVSIPSKPHQFMCRTCRSSFSTGKLSAIGEPVGETQLTETATGIASRGTKPEDDEQGLSDEVAGPSEAGPSAEPVNLGDVMLAAQRSSRWVPIVLGMATLACVLGLFFATLEVVDTSAKEDLSRSDAAMKAELLRLELASLGRQYETALAWGDTDAAVRIYHKMTAVRAELDQAIARSTPRPISHDADASCALWGLAVVMLIPFGLILEGQRARFVRRMVRAQIEHDWSDVQSSWAGQRQRGVVYCVYGRSRKNSSQQIALIRARSMNEAIATTKAETPIVPELCEQKDSQGRAQRYFRV